LQICQLVNYIIINKNNLDTFSCRLIKEHNNINEDETANYIVLSDDAFIFFEILNNNKGKIIFWSSLWALNDININKTNKIVKLFFSKEEYIQDISIKIQIDNVLFFKDILIKKMNCLKINCSSKNLFKGQTMEKKFTNGEINKMRIDEVLKYIKTFKNKIERGERNQYNIQLFNTFCRQAIEYYASIDDDSHLEILKMMKDILTT
jgi:hypothetical protein